MSEDYFVLVLPILLLIIVFIQILYAEGFSFGNFFGQIFFVIIDEAQDWAHSIMHPAEVMKKGFSPRALNFTMLLAIIIVYVLAILVNKYYGGNEIVLLFGFSLSFAALDVEQVYGFSIVIFAFFIFVAKKSRSFVLKHRDNMN